MSWWWTGAEENDDPRFRAAGAEGCGLYTMAGAWCYAQVYYKPESVIPPEWIVPDHYVRGWPGGPRIAKKLCAVGLWERAMGGYRFVWIRDQNTADHERARRKRERDKKAGDKG